MYAIQVKIVHGKSTLLYVACNSSENSKWSINTICNSKVKIVHGKSTLCCVSSIWKQYMVNQLYVVCLLLKHKCHVRNKIYRSNFISRLILKLNKLKSNMSTPIGTAYRPFTAVIIMLTLFDACTNNIVMHPGTHTRSWNCNNIWLSNLLHFSIQKHGWSVCGSQWKLRRYQRHGGPVHPVSLYSNDDNRW